MLLCDDVDDAVAGNPSPQTEASILRWVRSGHRGDETDCIISPGAIWQVGLLDRDGQEGCGIRRVFFFRP